MNLWMSSQQVVGLNSDHRAVIGDDERCAADQARTATHKGPGP